MKPSDSPEAGKVQGEGDYVSAKEFQKAQAAFASRPDEVAKGAKAAGAALDGPEGEALERARAKAAKGRPRQG